MAANTSPIFGLTPRASGIATGATANTAKDGTGTVANIITAGSNGSKVDRVFWQHMGTNAALLLRFFINNGSTNAVAANNFLIHEEVIAAWTTSETAASTSGIWACDLVLPAAYKLNVVISVNTTAGLMVTAEGADF